MKWASILTIILALLAQTVLSAQGAIADPVRTSAGSAASSPADGSWDALARLLAGLPASHPANPAVVERGRSWEVYSQALDKDWSNFKNRYLDRLGAWRTHHLTDARASRPAFYPFSGPDAASLLALFPDSPEYVMVGLEPIGAVSQMSGDYNAEYWASLREDLRGVTALGFFKTEDMHRQFSDGPVNGVLPLLLIMLARSGYSVLDVAQVDGSLTPGADQTRWGKVPGARIRFVGKDRIPRTLTYLSLDLSDPAMRRPTQRQALEDLSGLATFVKSASYLMHKPYFSTIRNTILSKSEIILQDDSGIPMRFLDPAQWDVRLYGTYTEPIPLFKDWLQEDLKAAFSNNASSGLTQPLNFGIGYRWQRTTSNLMLALRRRL